MNVATDYGAIDASNTATNKQSPSVCGGKLISAVLACVVVFAIVIYLSAGHFVPNGGAPLAQMAVDASTTTANTFDVENCALDEDISCDAKYGCFSYQEDIEAVMDIIGARWDDYVEYIEDKTDAILDDDDCVADKYLNRHLICTRSCQKLGYLTETKEANLCKNTFLDSMKSTLRPYRRACIASILAQQFTTVCQGRGDAASQAEIATFTWWARNYGVSASSWKHEDCPYYVI
eukprot:CAMPEP_0197046060 /NCGR_PEP_ID=MMETSP1384-20130603/21816_1 /TAXON_ID=29189 /ORGANISM="Ammonia sp." /LENGTH=233 /DNA_ID=CAMNT_0042477771 /DNA_START=89 /DNA_END=790 /DNA_ORIENTATION=-